LRQPCASRFFVTIFSLGLVTGGCAACQPQQPQTQAVVYRLAGFIPPRRKSLGVFFYDVVRNQDVAGNVTEKQNIEWYFDYSIEGKSEALPFASGSGYMPVAAYQQWQAKNAGKP
jgi:hypothetical protein